MTEMSDLHFDLLLRGISGRREATNPVHHLGLRFLNTLVIIDYTQLDIPPGGTCSCSLQRVGSGQQDGHVVGVSLSGV